MQFGSYLSTLDQRLGQWRGTGNGAFSPAQLGNLAAYYDFTDNNTLTEGAATNRIAQACDKSGNSNTMLLNFAGSAGCTVANVPAFGTGDFTVVAWVNVPAFAAAQSVVGGATNSFRLNIGTDAKPISAIQGGASNTASSGTVSAGALTCVAYTRTTNTGTYYLQGSAAGTTADAVDYAVACTTVGSTVSNGTPVAGSLHNIVLYSRALSGAEVAAMYAAGPAGTPPAGNLQLSPTQPLVRAATTITDTSGNSATITLPASGAWISGQRDLVQVTAANQPTLLPHTGTNYAWLPAAASNYPSTLDAVANQITGDVEILARLSMDNWTPGANQHILTKRGATASNFAYAFRMGSGNVLQFTYGDSSTTVVVATASAGLTGAVNGTPLWLKVNRVSATGAVNFYQAADSATIPSSWTTVGVAQSTTVGAIYAGTNTLKVGASDGTNEMLAGKVYYAHVSGTIGGAAAQKMVPSEAANNAASWTSSTGEVWTVNSTGAKPCQIVGKQSVLFDGSAYYWQTAPWNRTQPETQVWVIKTNTPTAGSSITGGATNNTLRVLVGPYQLSDGGGAACDNAGVADKTWGIMQFRHNGASSLIRANRGTATTGNPGTNGATLLTVGNRGDASGFCQFQASALLVFSAALSTSDLDRLVTWLGLRYGIEVDETYRILVAAGTYLNISSGTRLDYA